MQNNPRATHERLPDFCFQLKIYNITLTVNVRLARQRIYGACRFEQLRLQLRSVCRRNSERRRKHTCFVTASRIVRVQAVVAQFSDVNDGALSIWQ